MAIITKMELVGSFKDEVEAAALELIKNPNLKEVEVSEGLLVVRGNEILGRNISIVYERGDKTFAVTQKR